MRNLVSEYDENIKTGRGAIKLRMLTRMLPTLNTRSETSRDKLRKSSSWVA